MNIASPTSQSEAERRDISALDWLRVAGCIMVVTWHAEVLNVIAVNRSLRFFRDILSFNVLLVAVPIFIQISLFLFLKKRTSSSSYFVSKRLPRLIKLYVFWLTARLLFYMVVGISTVDFFDDLPSFLITLVSGANSEVYFVFALLVSTALSECFLRLLFGQKRKARFLWIKGLLLSSCLMIVLLSVTAIFTENGELCIWWNPINFLPYVFSSMILYDDFAQNIVTFQSPKMRLKLFILISLWLLSSILEWMFLNRPDIFGFALPQYSRISSVFASLLVIYTALMIFKRTPVWVKQISARSSGIYFIHRYFINRYSIGMLRDFLPAFSSFATVIVFIFGAASSYAIAHLMQRIKILRFVT